jgi:subtilase family serine protease/flagellar hook assembly protein FlgD/Tol biopolymer transport system component
VSLRFRALLVVPVVMGLLSAAPRAQSQHVRMIEDRDHVTVMEFGGLYDRQPPANFEYEQQVRQAVAREFLRTHTDDYDFLVVFTRFNYALGSDSQGAPVGGRYYGIKNDTQGIGLQPFDLTAAFGSASGRLQGYIDMGTLARLASDPTDPRFEQTLSTLSHEFLHRWGTHVRFRNPDGSLNESLLGREGSHWNFKLNTHNSVHYGHEWRDNGDGTFTSTGRAVSFYSPLDLYLMGMLDKTQVPPFSLIQNDDVAATRMPEVGVTIAGTTRTVTIDDVIAAEGERLPAAATAPKRFKIGFIYLVRPGEQADGLELAAINNIREAFSTRVLILTGGKGTAQVYPERPQETPEAPTPIPPPSSGPRSGPVDLVQAIDWLLARQAVDGSFADSTSTRVRDTSAALDLFQETPAAFTSYQKGLAWLSQLQEHLNVDMVSRRLLAIRPQYSATDAAFLAAARNASGGWGLRQGYQSDPLDTALALFATPAPGDITKDVAYLLSVQNADGGWGVRPGGASSVQGTIAVLRLASRYPSHEGLTAAVTRGLTWLQQRQNGDGGFGDAGSTVYETAQAVLYLLNTTFPRTDIAQALDYLRSRQLADGSWSESTYQTALAVRALKVAELTNAKIAAADVTVSDSTPVDGRPVTLRAMVSNDSVRDLQNLTVSLFDGQPAAGGIQIGADVTIANLPALSQLPVVFTWDTTGREGSHQLVVVLDRLAQLDEFNEADNSAAATVVVRPPPVEPDLQIGASEIAFTPALLQSLPQAQTVTAIVSNTGQTAVPAVVVSLYEGDPAQGRRVAQTTVAVPARGQTQATFSFQIEEAGERRYTVVIDPDGQVAEADETNNQAFQTLRVQSTHDFAVTPGSVTLSESSLGLGRDLVINAQIRNLGTTDAFAVAVRIFIDDPAGAIDVASQTIDLPAGGGAPITATWRTSRALANVPVVVVVDPANAFPENSESNNRASTPLTVTSSTQPNLRITPQAVQVSTPVNQGGTSTIAAAVMNTGAVEATNVQVAFYLGAPGAGGVQIGTTQVLPNIPAGGQGVASVAWTGITASGDQTMHVLVDPASAIAEFDEADNAAFVVAHVLSRADFVVTASEMRFSPAFPRQGDMVVVSAVIHNAGEQAATARVQFFDGDPARGGVALGSDQMVTLAGLGHATAQVAFASGAEATRTIHVRVDPLGEVTEQDETNNTAFRTLGVQDGALYASSLYFSPNGDGVQDTTELFFRFETATSVGSLGVYDRERRLVRTIDLDDAAVVSGSGVWNGLTDAGRLAPDGPYDVTVVSPAGAALGSARVVVDTNSSPIGDAVGTKFLLDTNLTCGVSEGNVDAGFQTVGWLPTDAGLILKRQSAAIEFPNRSLRYHDFPVGVFVVSPDGQTTTRITPDSWTVHPPAGNGTEIGEVVVSPDGQRVAIGIRRYRSGSQFVEYQGAAELWVVNVDGSGLRKVAETPAGAQLLTSFTITPVWSPAGDRLAYDLYMGPLGSPTERRLYVAQADGSGAAVVKALPVGEEELGEFTWSPSGNRLLYAVRGPFEPTGEAIRLISAQPDGSDEKTIATSVSDLDSMANIYWVDGQPVFRTSATLTPQGYFDWANERSLYRLSMTGSMPAPLSTGRVVDVRPSADLKAIAYQTAPREGDPGPTEIFVVDGGDAPRSVYASGPDTDRVTDLTWTTEGRRLSWIDYVITARRVCPANEGNGVTACPVTRAAIATAVLATGEVTSVPFGGDDELFEPVGFFADGNSFVFSENHQLIAVGVADGRRTVVVDDQFASLDDTTLTPSGKYLLYTSRRQSRDISLGCWKGDSSGTDEFLLSSVFNLTTQLAFKRDAAQLELRGTAADANLAGYTVEYAPVTSATTWSPIGAASDVAVVNDLLAQWIPPSEGSFHVRVTASDKAGNSASVRRRLVWGLTPTITNVTLTPRVASPNGDGARDAVTIDYFVLGPVNLTFEIANAAGSVVRTIQQSHAAMGAGSVAWDGRDEAGQFVADGQYRVRVFDYEFFVTIDTSAPDAAVAIGSGFHTVPQRITCVDPVNGTGCILREGPLVVTPFVELGGHVTDPQLASWKLEIGTGLNPADWAFVSEGSATHAAPAPFTTLSALDRVANRQYRLTAVDQAGNRRVVTSGFGPQELILHKYDGEEVQTTRTIEQRLGAHVLAMAYTGRTPLQSLAVQYRLQGTVTWNTSSATSAAGHDVALAWDNTTLQPGKIYEVRVVSTDANGGQLLSNAIAIRSNVFLFLNDSVELNAAFGLITLNESIASLKLVFGDDTDIGSGSSFNGQPEFSIGVAYDEQASPCTSVRVPARFRAVGASGRVYYSNYGAVTRMARPSATACKGPLELQGALEIKIETALAQACGLPSPGLTKIAMLGGGVIEPKLYMQQVPNGPLVELPGGEVVVNTAVMPEGRYTVRAVGRLAQAGTPEISDVDTLIVDRTAPAAQITYPAANQAFCPTKAGSRLVVPIEGVAQDPNFLQYAVEFGRGETPQAWIPVPAVNGGKAARTGVLANWDVTDLPAGTYTLRLKVHDKGGSLSCSEVTFFLPGAVTVQSAASDLRLISPNGDGKADGVSISYALDTAGRVSARVYPMTGEQRGTASVRTIFADAPAAAGTHQFAWDGRGDNGLALPDGTYVVVISAGSTCGNATEGSVRIDLDATPPAANVFAPVAGGQVSLVTAVTGSVSDPHFASYRLEVGEGAAPVAWTVLQTGFSPVTNSLLGTWTASVAPGPYTLRLTATDTAGNTREVLVPVSRTTTSGVVTALAAEPALFSPNNDLRLETTTVTVALASDARVRLEIVDAADAVVRTLSESDLRGGGSYTFAWDGRNQAGAVVTDAAYHVRVTATPASGGGDPQTERTSVSVDTTPPTVSAAVPAPGQFVRGTAAITGTFADANFDRYTVSYAAPGAPPVALAEGRQPRVDFVLATLPQLVDGAYVLSLVSTDLAQNSTTRDVEFVVDSTPPQAALFAPAAALVAGGPKRNVDVRGSVSDLNLESWTLRYGLGAEPASWVPLSSGNSAPPAGQVQATWDVGTLADGVYTLSLSATDKAGSVTETRVAVTVDNTAPVARISQPAAGTRVTAPTDIAGDATDENFASARLEFSEAGGAARFVTLADITSPVANGRLFSWQTLPPDATYTLRLTVTDALGQTAQATQLVTIDTEPPSAPSSLAATVENRRNARLTWTASTSADVAGYHVYRDGVKITSVPVVAMTYLDANLAEGRHLYVVKAVDGSSLESGSSNEASVRIDLTAPAARIVAPASGSRAGGIVELRGTASADTDFKEYRVLVGDGAAPGAFTLLRRSPSPVVLGVLAEYDTAGKAQGAAFTLRLEAEDVDGNIASEQILLTVDNLAPAAPVLTGATRTGSDVTVTWQPNQEPDLAGYLLYNNDLLANARRLVSGDLKPYLVIGSAYVDKALGDGAYEYYAFAMDTAGNVSPTSNKITITLETRAPRATIVQPATGSKTEHGVVLVATSPDSDIARIQFQYRRAGVTAYTNIGAPVTAAPYEQTWNPQGLPFADYEFRAVATDTSNKTDTAPPVILITLKDLTAPAVPAGLAAAVNAATVTLTWQAVQAADLAGYAVYRQKGSGTPVKVNGATITGTTLTQSNVTDGAYVYTVRSLDQGGNQSEPSAPAPALVYAPVLSAPAACSADAVTTIAGTGAAPGATVRLYAGTAATAPLVATALADAAGAFSFANVALADEPIAFTAAATDASGNTSKRSSGLSLSKASTPAQPTNFVAQAAGSTITLTWDANPSASGFVLTRDGVALNATADVTASADARASTEEDFAPAFFAIDGDNSTGWIPYAADAQPALTLDLPAQTLLARLELRWTADAPSLLLPPTDYDVQRFDGAAWTTVHQVRGNTDDVNVLAFAQPFQAAGVRIVSIVTAPGATVQLVEVQVFSRALVTGAGYTDAGVANGVHVYTLAALNACGIGGPAAEAQAGVGDVTPPSAPSGLAAAVAGSSVSLSWSAPSDTDVAGYIVYRRSSQGEWMAITQTPVTGLAYVDADVPNGAYSYRVIARDTSGNQSAPSNEATATLDVAPPAAPGSLTVSAPAVGAALDLSWDAVPGVAGYRVFRSVTAGGPYAAAGDLATGTSTRDLGLANGTRYYYVVRAAGAAGNLSAPSVERDGVPSDTVAPVAPVLLFPTDAASPRTMAASTTFVTGLAEPGSAVTLLTDGIAIATTQAAQANALQTLTFEDAGFSTTVVAADALVASFSRSQPGVPSRLLTLNLLSGEHGVIEGPSAGSEVAFSRDGRLALYKSGASLQLLDRVSGTTRAITIPTSDARVFRFSPDGTRLAFLATTAGIGTLRVVELATGATVTLVQGTAQLFEPAWSPSGSSIAYVQLAGSAVSVRLVDRTSAAVTIVDSEAVIQRLSFSPDGATLAYTARRSGHDEAWLYDVASQSVSPLVSDGATRKQPMFSLDGGEIAYAKVTPAGTELRVRDRATGADTVVLSNMTTTGRIDWLRDRTLLVTAGTQVTRIRRAGTFIVPAVAIPLPENRFSAVAADAAGNIGAPADPITLLRETSLPDLAIGDESVVVFPRYPLIGETVRLTATVKNNGDVDARQVSVGVYYRDAQGGLTPIGALRTLPLVAAHAQASVSADWAPGTLLGAQTLVVRVDPANAIPEVSDINNEGRATIVITADGAPMVTVRSQLPAYPAGGLVTIDGQAVNPGAAGDFDVELSIEDEGGFLVAPLGTQRLTGFGAASHAIRAEWDSTGVLPGAYRVRAVFRRIQGGEVAAVSPFSLLGEERGEATVVTERATYQAGDLVRIASTVRNTSVTSDLGPLMVATTILDASGMERFRADAPVSVLAPGSQADLPSQWVAAPGAYTARVAVTSAGREIAIAASTFSVAGASRVTGRVTASASVAAPASPIAFDAVVNNSGTAAVTGATLILQLVDLERQTAVRTFERPVDLPAGGSVSWPVSTTTAGLELKTYSVLLQLRDSATQPIAATTLAVVDRQAPVVALASPQAGAFLNTDVTLAAIVTDDASGVASVEVQVDGGPWRQMTPADPAAGRFTATFAASAASEGPHVFTVRATDRSRNSADTSSSDANPLSRTFIVDVTAPEIAITGVEEGGRTADPVTPVITVTDANAVTSDIHLDGQPFVSGTQVAAAGLHVLSVTAKDAAGNVASRSIVFTVGAENTPPVAGDQSLTLDEDSTVAVVLGAVDADGGPDPLTFSVVTPPAHGVLSGTAPNLTYTPDANYHGPDSFTFRASDGAAQSAPATISFAVSPVNDRPTAGAGLDSAANEGDRVRLDGTASMDIDGDTLTYAWTQIAGVPVTIDLSDPAHPTFIAPDVQRDGGTLTFQLVVSDARLTSAPAVVNVRVKDVNNAPQADAGPDQTVREDTVVTLNAGSSFDPDGDPLTFTWRQTEGPQVVLSAADRAAVTFTAPLVSLDALLTFEVAVDDGLATRTDSITVRVQSVNHAPVARAGADQVRNEGEIVTLDGAASSDQDGDALTYHWTQVSGPVVVLSDPAAASPAFVAPAVSFTGAQLVFRLVVSDGVDPSAPDEVTVSVRDTAAPPSCSAARPSTTELWPPNQQIMPVSIAALAEGLTVTIGGVTQDEPTNDAGDGNSSPDAFLQGASVLLRAERSGTGDGRIYRVSFTAANPAGATCTGTVTVGVPKSPSQPAVDSGQLFDATKK